MQQSIDLMFLLILQLLMHLTQAGGTMVMGWVLDLARPGHLGIIEMQVGHETGTPTLGVDGAWRIGVAHAGIDGCCSLQ